MSKPNRPQRAAPKSPSKPTGAGPAGRSALEAEPLDLRRITTEPLAGRSNLVRHEAFARVPRAGAGVLDWLQTLPEVGHRANGAVALRKVVVALLEARTTGRGRVWAIGPHLIKQGLSPLIIDLMRRGFITAVATTGAGAIHDVELGLIGQTSEEMAGRIATGSFGMATETGATLAEGARRAVADAIAFGSALGKGVLESGGVHAGLSILAAASEMGVPATVHVALGTDIVHMHPSADGALIGQASFNDFRRLANIVSSLNSGGVYLNVVSSVLLPEVFLKALTAQNNVRRGEGTAPLADFLAVVVDQESQYRPLMNVVRRPTEGQGEGIELLGRVEVLIPLLAWCLSASDEAG